MSQFRVNTKSLGKSVSDQKAIDIELKTFMACIAHINNVVSSNSCGADITRKLNDIADDIKMHSDGLNYLAQGLEKTILLYTTTENKLINAGNDQSNPRGSSTAPDVYDPNGKYGGDQGAPVGTYDNDPEQYQKLYDIVKKYNPDMTDEEVYEFLAKLNSEGCGYVASINSLFEKFKDDPEGFKNTFGFEMYNEDGTYNYNEVLVDLYCKEDNHNKKGFWIFSWDSYNPDEDWGWSDEDGDGTKEWTKQPYGMTQGQIEYRWESYCKDHGVDVNVKTSVRVTPDNYSDYAKDGTVSIMCSKFDMYDESGNKTHVEGGHFMTITGVTEDGKYEVSSWGQKYILNKDDIKGFVNYQSIEY